MLIDMNMKFVVRGLEAQISAHLVADLLATFPSFLMAQRAVVDRTNPTRDLGYF
jgi:hypothetical protein